MGNHDEIQKVVLAGQKHVQYGANRRIVKGLGVSIRFLGAAPWVTADSKREKTGSPNHLLRNIVTDITDDLSSLCFPLPGGEVTPFVIGLHCFKGFHVSSLPYLATISF